MLGDLGAENQKGNRAQKYFAASMKVVQVSQMTEAQVSYKARETICYWVAVLQNKLQPK